MPSYTPNTPKHGEVIILELGEYYIEVIEAEEKDSGNGNPMIDLKCQVIGRNGRGALVWDSLVFTEKASWKIDNFRATIGDSPSPDEGEVLIDANYCKGARGWVRIDNEVITSGKHAGKHKNVIVAWLFDYDPSTANQEARRPAPPANQPRQAQPPARQAQPPARQQYPPQRPPARNQQPDPNPETAPDDIPF